MGERTTDGACILLHIYTIIKCYFQIYSYIVWELNVKEFVFLTVI